MGGLNFQVCTPLALLWLLVCISNFAFALRTGHPQIEHHLFPNLNPMLYPQMAQRVRAICAAHKPHAVRYQHYDTLYDALAATLRNLQRLGNPKSA